MNNYQLTSITTAIEIQKSPYFTPSYERCAWCWQHLYPDQNYPSLWSSTICPAHATWLRDKHKLKVKQQSREHPYLCQDAVI